MNMSATPGTVSSEAFDIAEYSALRNEILMRILIQNLILILLIPLFAALAAIGFHRPSLAAAAALVYLVASGMGALYWVHNGARTVQLKTYLLLVERRLGGAGRWESWLASHRFDGMLGSRWVISTKGAILGSQICLLAVPVVARSEPVSVTVMLVLGLAGVVACAILLILPKRLPDATT
jgi:hypothetical protein